MTTAARKMSWLFLDTKYRHDVTLGELPKDIRFDYFAFYMIAREADAEGILAQNNKPLTIGNLAWELRDTKENIEKSLDALIEVGLMHFEDGGYCISRFMDEQTLRGGGEAYQKKLEYDRAYQAEKRSKIKKVSSSFDDSNEIKEEQNKVKEIKKEEIKEEEIKIKQSKVKESKVESSYDILEESYDNRTTISDDDFSSLVTESFRDLAESYYDQRHNFNQDLERLISFVEKVNPDQDTIYWLFERTKKNFRTVDDIFDKGIDVLIDNLVEKTGYVEETELPF